MDLMSTCREVLKTNMKKIKLPRDDILKAEQYRTENTVGANKGLIRGS